MGPNMKMSAKIGPLKTQTHFFTADIDSIDKYTGLETERKLHHSVTTAVVIIFTAENSMS